jgi:hypothetical protein
LIFRIFYIVNRDDLFFFSHVDLLSVLFSSPRYSRCAGWGFVSFNLSSNRRLNIRLVCFGLRPCNAVGFRYAIVSNETIRIRIWCVASCAIARRRVITVYAIATPVYDSDTTV